MDCCVCFEQCDKRTVCCNQLLCLECESKVSTCPCCRNDTTGLKKESNIEHLDNIQPFLIGMAMLSFIEFLETQQELELPFLIGDFLKMQQELLFGEYSAVLPQNNYETIFKKRKEQRKQKQKQQHQQTKHLHKQKRPIKRPR